MTSPEPLPGFTAPCSTVIGARLSSVVKHDKPLWVAELAGQLGQGLETLVGDSPGDMPMLREAGHPFLVGAFKPEGLYASAYFPDGNIIQIAKRILDVSA